MYDRNLSTGNNNNNRLGYSAIRDNCDVKIKYKERGTEEAIDFIYSPRLVSGNPEYSRGLIPSAE